MNEITIKIADVAGTDIRSRSRVRQIVQLMQDNSTANLDFAGVEFISRSFADELLSLRDSKDRLIKIINLYGEAQSMLEIVSSARNQSIRETLNSNVVKLKSIDEVKEFFSTL